MAPEGLSIDQAIAYPIGAAAAVAAFVWCCICKKKYKRVIAHMGS